MSVVCDIDALLSWLAILEKTVGLYEKVDIFTERISWLEIKDFSFRELFFFVRSNNINSMSNG